VDLTKSEIKAKLIEQSHLNQQHMGRLKRSQTKLIVKDALLEVADFNGEFEQFTFTQFREFHKKVFLAALKRTLNVHPYFKNDGSQGTNRYYDITLNDTIYNSWKSFKSCIDYMQEDHAEFQTGHRERLSL